MSSSIASQLRFLLTHSTIYGIGTVLSKAVAFLMLPLYTNYLDPAAYGLLELTETTLGMIGMVAGLGITAAMTRFYFDYDSDQDRGRVVSTVYITTAGVSVLVVGATIALATPLALLAFGSAGSYVKLLVVGAGAMGMGVLLDVFLTYLRIRRRPAWYLSLSTANLLLSVSLNLYFLIVLKQGVLGILYASFISKTVLAVPTAIALLARVGVKLDLSMARRMLRYSLPLIPSEIANTVVSSSDRYFINHMVSTFATGIYGLAQKLGGVLHVLVTSPFILAFLPARFELAKRPDAARLFALVFDAYMLVMVTLTLALSVFADPIVRFMADPQFAEARYYVPAIALSALVMGLKYHFQFGVLYSKKTQYVLYVNLVSLVIQLSGNFLLIRSLGLWGAILAFFCATLANVSLYLWLSQREFRIEYHFRKNVILISLAIGAFALTYAWGNHPPWFDMLARVGVLAGFAAAVVLCGIVRVQDITRALSSARGAQQQQV